MVAAAILGATIAFATAAPAQATFPGANGDVAFSAPGPAGSEIYRVPPSGGAAVNITQQPGNDYQPAWSPDGSKIAFAHEDPTTIQRDIWVLDAASPGQPVKVTNDVPNDNHMTWSPDGSMIAFERRVGATNFDIYVAPSDGTGSSTPLITGAGFQAVPVWSPDGTRLAFTDDSSGSTNVYVVAANGMGPHVPIAATPTSIESNPDWSPDSTRLAMARDGHLLIANANGTGAEQPLPGGNREQPVWSPDGTRLAFSSAGFPGDISTVGVDGSGEAPVVNSADDESTPDWQRVEPPDTDATPPETTIVSGPKRKTKKKRATFQFVSSEPGSSFQCSVDGSPFAACASGDGLKVKRGKHVFEVRATDAAGNVDASPAQQRWKVKKRRKRHGKPN